MSQFAAFSILVDEIKDASKKDQLSFLISFINKNYNIQEKALGCYHMQKCHAHSMYLIESTKINLYDFCNKDTYFQIHEVKIICLKKKQIS